MTKFNPPTNFPLDKPGEWPEWKQRFVRFRTATKLDKEDGPIQVSILIYARGSESENRKHLLQRMDTEMILTECLESSMSILCQEGM